MTSHRHTIRYAYKPAADYKVVDYVTGSVIGDVEPHEFALAMARETPIPKHGVPVYSAVAADCVFVFNSRGRSCYITPCPVRYEPIFPENA